MFTCSKCWNLGEREREREGEREREQRERERGEILFFIFLFCTEPDEIQTDPEANKR